MTWVGLKNQTRKYSLSMYIGPSSGRRPTWNACFCLLSCSQSNWELPQLGFVILATALWPKWGHFYSWYFDNKADIVHMILPAVSLQRQNFNTDLSIRKHAGLPLSHFPRIATNSFHGFQRTFLCSHVWHGIEITIFFVLYYKKTSQELRMLSRSPSDCKSLNLNFMIQVSQFVSNVNCVTKSLNH